MKWPVLPLKQLVDFDPTPPRKQLLAVNPVVAFMPMASVVSESSVATTALERPAAEVLAGYTYFQAEDVLVAKITPCFENGKIAIADISHECGFGTTEFHVIRVKPAILDAKYLTHFLRQPWIVSEGERKMTGSAGQRRVPRHFLEGLETPVPALEEQRRIAAILDQAEALRAKRRQALAKLDTLTQSLFLEMFGRIEPDTRSMKQALQDIVDPDRPICYGILMPGEPQDQGVQYVRVADMKDGAVDLRGVRKTTEAISNQYRRSLLKRGDLLMSIRGHVGRLASIAKELDGANITQDSARLAISKADPRYIRELLRTVPYQRWMQKHTKGAAVSGLNLGDLKSLPVHLPDANLQRRFGEEADMIQSLRSRSIKAIDVSNTMFASLQHKAFRGEL
ncbi:restriction endonuclease subunit S [Silvibacterium acidisoli]|uniref:restriction endonuclease subunit S n=1 Tax=Acidobacteriaceae bacterium ZG23-2 TaxID=2883246 RepID=UPI00406BF7F5